MDLAKLNAKIRKQMRELDRDLIQPVLREKAAAMSSLTHGVLVAVDDEPYTVVMTKQSRVFVKDAAGSVSDVDWTRVTVL
jgi:sensor histidine kinase regulating citrate/malate metabolism